MIPASNSPHQKGAEQPLVLKEYRKQMLTLLQTNGGRQIYRVDPEKYVDLIDMDLLATCAQILTDIRKNKLEDARDCELPYITLVKKVNDGMPLPPDVQLIEKIFKEKLQIDISIEKNRGFFKDLLVGTHLWNKSYKLFESCFEKRVDFTKMTLGFSWFKGNAYIESNEDPKKMIEMAIAGTHLRVPNPTSQLQKKIENTQAEKFYNQAKSGLFTDIKFIVDGEEFHAHHCYINAVSPELERLYLDHKVQHKNGDVYIADMNSDVFRGVMDFIYLGKLPEAPKGIDEEAYYLEVRRAAERFQLKELVVLIDGVESLLKDDWQDLKPTK